MTRASELTTYHQDELVSRLDEARKELTALKFRAATNQLSDVAAIKKLKREVARLITILHERELEIVHLAPMPKKESEAGAKYQKDSEKLYGTKARIAQRELEEAQREEEFEEEDFEDEADEAVDSKSDDDVVDSVEDEKGHEEISDETVDVSDAEDDK